jgi:hypothetical protein
VDVIALQPDEAVLSSDTRARDRAVGLGANARYPKTKDHDNGLATMDTTESQCTSANIVLPQTGLNHERHLRSPSVVGCGGSSSNLRPSGATTSRGR